MKLILLFLPRSKAVAQRNLELAFPEKSFAEREKIRKQAINVLADNLIGFAWAPSLNKTSVRQLGDFSSAIALVRKATENQTKGAIFLIPHFGRFELIAQIWAIAYQPGWIIARGFNLPRFSRWWNSIRECHGNKILDRNGAYQEIMPLLKNGKNVSIMFDQNVKRNHAIFVDLFGIKAATTKSFALAALRTGSPIIFAAIIEKSYKKFEIEAREIYNPWQEDKPAEQKIEEITLEANRCLEDIIRRHPEHWFWIHRRFKTRPVGEPEDIYQTSGATF